MLEVATWFVIFFELMFLTHFSHYFSHAMQNNPNCSVIFMYSITDSISFKELESYMAIVQSFKHLNSISDIPVLLVGNKSDLEAERVVSKLQLSQFANKLNMEWIESSAKQQQDVTALIFEKLCSQILKYKVLQYIKKCEEKQCIQKPKDTAIKMNKQQCLNM